MSADWGIDTQDNPTLKVSADFLNPKEGFEVQIYFDGDVEDPDIYCRMEEVKVVVRRGEIAETAGQLALEALTKAIGLYSPFR